MERGFRLCQGNRVAVFVTRSLKILVALILLSSCASGSNNLEFKIVEEAIPEVLLPDLPHLVTEVSCPEYVNRDLGTIFCTLQVAGKEISVSITGPDVTNSFTVNPRIKIVKAIQLAQKVKRRLDDDLGVENQIECAPEIRVAHPGELFECEIIDQNGGVHYLQTKIIDFDGSFEIIG